MVSKEWLFKKTATFLPFSGKLYTWNDLMLYYWNIKNLDRHAYKFYLNSFLYLVVTERVGILLQEYISSKSFSKGSQKSPELTRKLYTTRYLQEKESIHRWKRLCIRLGKGDDEDVWMIDAILKRKECILTRVGQITWLLYTFIQWKVSSEVHPCDLW